MEVDLFFLLFGMEALEMEVTGLLVVGALLPYTSTSVERSSSVKHTSVVEDDGVAGLEPGGQAHFITADR